MDIFQKRKMHLLEIDNKPNNNTNDIVVKFINTHYKKVTLEGDQ